MRNRKYLSVLVVFLAVLCVGVGYAAITRTLNIGATALTADEETLREVNFDVKFGSTAFSIDSQTEGSAIASISSTATAGKELLSCKFAADMKVKGAYAELSNTIVNYSKEYGATLTPTLTGTGVSKLSDGVYKIGDYYKLTVTLSKNALTYSDGETYDIADVSVRIEMIKTPTEAQAEVDVTLTFTAAATEKP